MFPLELEPPFIGDLQLLRLTTGGYKEMVMQGATKHKSKDRTNQDVLRSNINSSANKEKSRMGMMFRYRKIK
jgi:hypothetical protein